MSNDPDPNEAARNTALDHAWAWFSLHATQRLQTVNFFLVATAFLTAAFVTAAEKKLHVVAAAVAVLAICVSYYFYRMERRIQSLIHASEDAIGPLQQTLADKLNVDAIRIVAHVEHPGPGEWKYSRVFRLLFFTTGILFACGFAYALWAEFNTPASGGGASSTEVLKIVLHGVLGVFLVLVGYEMLVGDSRRVEQKDAVTTATRWAFVGLGIGCILGGTVAILYLIFNVL